MSLANKFRPSCFAEVVGQNSIVSILSRQIATKAFKQSYLFTGPHGCGKTTVARIMANEVNGGFGDPIEIDAASNNGIDNIRNLIIDAQQSAIDCDYKVYIIDECHQLTRAAWDAALKLIEEPPTGTIFIFCTTNPSKIPETILSRVQRFDFTRIPSDLILDRLQYICNEALFDVEVAPEALHRIAVLANGHLRDALVMLDKCLDYNNILTLDVVECALGVTRVEHLYNIVKFVNSGDLDNCLNVLNKIVATDTNLINFYDELICYILDCLIYHKLNNIKYTNLSKVIDYEINFNKIDIFLNCLINFRNNLNETNSIMLIKAIIIKMCR